MNWFVSVAPVKKKKKKKKCNYQQVAFQNTFRKPLAIFSAEMGGRGRGSPPPSYLDGLWSF